MIPYLVSIPDNTDRKLLSRSGYELPELVGAVNKHLGMTGIEATGKLMHFTADLVTSGGKDIWCRLCYEHAFENIGLASPRIFTYLKRRCQELDGSYERMESESFYRSYEIQKKLENKSVDNFQKNRIPIGTCRNIEREAVRSKTTNLKHFKA